MKIRFLLDENLSPKIKFAVLRLNPAIDIVRVGDPDAPPLGTLDLELLRYLEVSERLLVTDNRNSMSGHLEEHWASGGRIWRVMWLRPGTTLGSWAEAIFLLWETTDSE
ncbi:MAG: hypothetical protein ACKO9I_15285, partial [Sphaerospermopsis kisseleviana]